MKHQQPQLRALLLKDLFRGLHQNDSDLQHIGPPSRVTMLPPQDPWLSKINPYECSSKSTGLKYYTKKTNMSLNAPGFVQSLFKMLPTKSVTSDRYLSHLNSPQESTVNICDLIYFKTMRRHQPSSKSHMVVLTYGSHLSENWFLRNKRAQTSGLLIHSKELFYETFQQMRAAHQITFLKSTRASCYVFFSNN